MGMTQRKLLDPESWKQEARKLGRAPEDEAGKVVPLIKACTFATSPRTKAVEVGSPPPTIIISTQAVDRHSDTVAVNGWELANYERNAVVLWCHESWSAPVARSQRIFTDMEALKATPEFMPEGTPGKPELYSLVEWQFLNGFLNAASVGFRPVKYAWNEARGDWAMDFLAQELLEWSFVPIPANPECLVEAKQAGMEEGVKELVTWAERVLDGAHLKGVWEPGGDLWQRLEKTRKVAGAERRFFILRGVEVRAESLAKMGEALGAPVVSLPDGATLLEVEGKELRNVTPSKADNEPDDEPDEEPMSPAGPIYKQGDMVECNRPEKPGKAEVVEVVASAHCYAVRFDGEEVTTRYLLESEMERAEGEPAPEAAEDEKAIVTRLAESIKAKLAGMEPGNRQ